MTKVLFALRSSYSYRLLVLFFKGFSEMDFRQFECDRKYKIRKGIMLAIPSIVACSSNIFSPKREVLAILNEGINREKFERKRGEEVKK